MNVRPLQFALLLAAIATTPFEAHAQAAGSTTYSFSAKAGLAVPTGDLSNFTSSGYSVAAALGMHQALTPLSLRVEGSFTELPFSDNTGNSGGKHRIFGISLDGLYNLGTPSTNGGLYLTGGAGYYGTNNTDTFFGDTNRD